MSIEFDAEEARAIASEIILHFQQFYPQHPPMLVMASMALAMGQMAAAMTALGATKAGHTRHLVDHLADMMKLVAEDALDTL